MLYPLNRCVLGAVLALLLTVCAALQDAPVKPIQLTRASGPSPFPIAGSATATLLPAKDCDLVTSRPNPAGFGQPVFCAQPNPNLATAFGKTAQGGGGTSAGPRIGREPCPKAEALSHADSRRTRAVRT